MILLGDRQCEKIWSWNSTEVILFRCQCAAWTIYYFWQTGKDSNLSGGICHYLYSERGWNSQCSDAKCIKTGPSFTEIWARKSDIFQVSGLMECEQPCLHPWLWARLILFPFKILSFMCLLKTDWINYNL